MGNETGTKEKIFSLLKDSDDVLSGERISDGLGISRVSVWKHIKRMVADGIPIASSSRGYRLVPDPDSLNPLEFGDRAGHIHYFRETVSTMDEATTLARAGCPDFTVAVAARQTAGRGRMERVWVSGSGGLYFTVVVRPDLSVAEASLVNLAAAVEMAHLLRTAYKVPAVLKWPNDILVNGRKICGILSRMETEAERIAHLSIGIGLNVNNDPPEQQPPAVSLKAVAGHDVPRRKILTDFLDRFENRLGQFDSQSVIADWKKNNMTIGTQVVVKTFKDTVQGRATDIDSGGGLILELEDGRLQTIVHGDCFQKQ
jgi:BirA family biotin operon repressor/biotin-[acetyl-CoA-carboxylase] ligase